MLIIYYKYSLGIDNESLVREGREPSSERMDKFWLPYVAGTGSYTRDDSIGEDKPAFDFLRIVKSPHAITIISHTGAWLWNTPELCWQPTHSPVETPSCVRLTNLILQSKWRQAFV